MKKKRIGSNLDKVDADIVTQEDLDEIPERTEEDFARAKPHIGGKPVTWEEARAEAAKLGRPKSANPKEHVNLRLDADVVAYYRASGAGWQTRINETLRRAAHLPIKGSTRSAKKKTG